ncbi:phage tail assembly protein [Shinella sp. CPCC 100929]|uniref:Phage tail assembly protein n=1 Tax=Shinella lacus TaxID=2654216 RepID=A0ABT1R7A7_9HYPH|nr:phage tail assembly protein [Shinella lacus]MCQ4630949.1 phage tail assembly protein [Shinella lacus]
MPAETIHFSRKVDFGDQAFTSITLREMEAGDYFDAAAMIREGASRAELEAQVAAICADVPFALIRKLRPADIVKVSSWYDRQWQSDKASGDEGDVEDPSKAGAAGQPS